MEVPARRDVLLDPAWRAEDLGQPLPDDPHAVSVALPLWRHCVAYEEGDQEVIARLRCGYPRFVFHPLVQRAAALARERLGRPGEQAMLLASELCARRAADHVKKRSGEAARVEPWDPLRGAWALLVPDHAAAAGLVAPWAAAREYWQHAGEGISSRQAESLLTGSVPDPVRKASALGELRTRLSGMYGCGGGDLFLYANGMAACAAALRTWSAYRPGRRSVQLGFPYVDVLKVPQRLGSGAELIPGADRVALARLGALLASETLAACVIETPGNPLLTCVDVPALSALLRPERVPLVVDDTVATTLNVDVGPWADLVFSSLTKSFVGSGTVMGGVLVVPPASPLAGILRPYAQAQHEDLLWWEDALLLAEESRDMPQRVARMNASATEIAARLAAHPAVARVHHPSLTDRTAYDRIRRQDGGHGCLLSFELKAGPQAARACYDAAQVNKGPSLGTDFSLLCPFTQLAHYQELPWAESCGVSPWLLRLSVGLEEVETLWQGLLFGLTAAGLALT